MVDKLTAYAGAGKYFFVSYAHEDAAMVMPEIEWLQEAGFNIWYDEGIHVGSVWRQALADALSESCALIYFATAKSVESSNCLKELNFILDEEKPVFVVQLDGTSLPSLLRLSLSDRQALMRSEFDERDYRDRLISALSTITPPEESEDKTKPRSMPTQVPSIAMQPIVGPVGDNDLAFWAEGVVDDLQTFLSHRGFRIVATHDTKLDARSLGSDLDVHFVLSGTVRSGGDDRLRVNLKLIDASSSGQVWGERFDIVGDRLDAADSLSREAATKVSEAILDSETQRVRHMHEDELDAWGLCLKADPSSMNTVQKRDEVIRLLRLAVELDPDFGFAHGMLAGWLSFAILTLFSKDPEADKAEALHHAERAMTLSPSSAIAMFNSSFVNRLFGSEELALELAQQANDTAGSDSLFGARYIGNVLYASLIQYGRAKEVIELAEQDHPPPTRTLCLAHVIGGTYAESLKWAQRSVASQPEFYLAYVELANVLGHLGRIDEGKAAIDKVISFVPTFKLQYFEKGTHLSWGKRLEVIEPQYMGLRKLGID